MIYWARKSEEKKMIFSPHKSFKYLFFYIFQGVRRGVSYLPNMQTRFLAWDLLTIQRNNNEIILADISHDEDTQ